MPNKIFCFYVLRQMLVALSRLLDLLVIKPPIIWQYPKTKRCGFITGLQITCRQ